VPALRPNVPPPPHYYAENLVRLLDAVSRQYSDILLPRERDYVQRVLALACDAQRLYARLLTRTRTLVRVDSLDYREVANVADAIGELEAAGLVQLNPPVPADQALIILTRAELQMAFPHVGARGVRKELQIVSIAARYPDHRIRDVVCARHPLCAACGLDIVATLQILFFGDARTDLRTFVLEDLGMLRFESYPLNPDRRQFGARGDFDDYLAMQRLRAGLRELELRWQTHTAQALVDQLWANRPHRVPERLRAGMLNQLGRCAERAGEYELALSAYARSPRPPARERRTRLLRRLGDEDGALAMLDHIDVAPLSAGERFFAQQFRAGRRARALAIPERTVRLPAAPDTSVETAALGALTQRGGSGRHLENLLPLGMLGLAFWDVVFAPIDAAFVNPYQVRPVDLYWSDFRRARAALVESRFDALRRTGALLQAVSETAQAKRGIANALVDWRAFDSSLIECAATSIPTATWLAVFDHMLDDLEQTRTGFPDLALFFGAGQFEFVEVKGPGDQLRREQRLWFEFFARNGVPAYVLHVEW
jgi:hypothetical protein